MTDIPVQSKEIYPSIDQPWKQYYPEEIFQETLPEKSMYDFVYDMNKDYPDDIALEYLDIKVTYGEMFRRIEETACALKGLGVRPGDVVTIAMVNTPEFVYLAYAVNRVGAVMSNVHPLAGAHDMIQFLNEAESRFFFMFDGTWRMVHDFVKDTLVEKAVVVSPVQSLGFVKRKLYRLSNSVRLDRSVAMDWEEFLKAGKGVEPEFPEKDPSLPAVITYTGDNVGVPLGVQLSDNAENAHVFQVMKTIALYKERQNGMLVVLPPFVNYFFTAGIHEGLSVDCRVALIADYKSDHFGEYYEKYHVNFVSTISHYCMDMMNDEKCRNMDLSGLKRLIVAGADMDMQKEHEINQFLHEHGAQIDLIKVYGRTEVGVATFTSEEVNFPETAGIPLFMNCIKIVDEDSGEELPLGEVGEVCITGPGLMIGYMKNQEATDDSIRVHEDGKRWLHMGEFGYIDEHGALFVAGRIKRVRMTVDSHGNTTKIFPRRIEQLFQTFPEVRESCSVDIWDKDRAYIPKAVVVLEEEYADEDQDELRKKFLERCRENLPDYMIPDIIEFMDELPRNRRGKVDYRALENTDTTNE